MGRAHERKAKQKRNKEEQSEAIIKKERQRKIRQECEAFEDGHFSCRPIRTKQNTDQI